MPNPMLDREEMSQLGAGMEGVGLLASGIVWIFVLAFIPVAVLSVLDWIL